MRFRGSRTALKAWMLWKWRVFGGIPRPTDSAFASASGEPVLECVAFGNGALSSWGVGTHHLGLVGALARSLSRRFGRGVNVRGTIDVDLTVSTMRAAAAATDVPWASAQVGIIAFGLKEIFQAPTSRPWERDLEGLVTDVRGRMPAGSMLVVVGIPPISALSFVKGVGRSAVGRLIERTNERADAVCEAIEGVHFMALPDPGPVRSDQYRAAEHYSFWADVIAARVAMDVATVGCRPTSAAERSRTVEQFNLLDGTKRIEPFDRVVRLAQQVFHTRSAAFTVLHEDWHLDLSNVGVEGDRLPRSQSICDITVDQAAPLVIGDIWSEGRFATNDVVRTGRGVRFYAGYPLRAPDGNFIGTLCVFDPDPRDPHDIDVTALRELALMIEAELSGQRAS